MSAALEFHGVEKNYGKLRALDGLDLVGHGGQGKLPLENWDAAWVFVKFRMDGGEWQHAWLNDVGQINPTGSTVAIGLLKPDSAFNPTTNPGLGAFIYRDADGTGSFSATGFEFSRPFMFHLTTPYTARHACEPYS